MGRRVRAAWEPWESQAEGWREGRVAAPVLAVLELLDACGERLHLALVLHGQLYQDVLPLRCALLRNLCRSVISSCRGKASWLRLGQLALRRPLSAPDRASGRPELRPASANQPLGPRWHPGQTGPGFPRGRAPSLKARWSSSLCSSGLRVTAPSTACPTAWPPLAAPVLSISAGVICRSVKGKASRLRFASGGGRG